MIISLLFIFFLLVENLFLPALIGPEPFFITMIFVFTMIVYTRNIRSRLILAGVFLFLSQIIAGAGYFSFLIPFYIVGLIYIWASHYLEISPGLQDSNSFLSLLAGAIVLLLLVSAYSFIYLFLGSSFNLAGTWADFIILIKTSVYQNLVWSFFFVILFKYVLRAK
jgi:hypothetical protein